MHHRLVRTFEQLRSEQRKWFQDNLALFKRAFQVLRIVICAFMFAWIGGVICLAGFALREMLSGGEPLIINGRASTWAESIGFVVLILGMGVCGVASMLWALRLFRKSLALPEARKTDRG